MFMIFTVAAGGDRGGFPTSAPSAAKTTVHKNILDRVTFFKKNLHVNALFKGKSRIILWSKNINLQKARKIFKKKETADRSSSAVF